jgi:anti-sigma regulatory factor (Ser/Thr protein kinase)
MYGVPLREAFFQPTTSETPMRRTVKLEVQPNVREGAVARRVALAAMKDDHASQGEVADVELVTSELVTNAVEASRGGDTVSFSMELSDGNVRVSVTNRGLGFEPKLAATNPEDIRGRGLAIVKSIGDLTVEHDEGTTTVSVDIALSAKSNAVSEQGRSRDTP